MNRQIKFRGQNIKGEWHYGLLSHNKDVDSDYEWFISNKAGKPFAFGAIEKSIGQFTGLYDSNGKEIFEGDIVQTPKGIATITFDIGCFYAKTISNYRLGGWDKHTIEVIGNIFDIEINNIFQSELFT